jgi:Flp pilus assembly protein TadG
MIDPFPRPVFSVLTIGTRVLFRSKKCSSPSLSSFGVCGLCKDERGTIAVMTGLCATAIVGFAALAIDVGSWEVAKRSMQGAADMAAYSAAIAYGKNDGTSITTQAKGVTAALGYVDGQNGVTVSVNQPPTSGAHVGTASAIQVIVQQPQPLYFAGLFLSSNPTVTAGAVAAPSSSGSACMLALSTSANQAINVSGSGSVNAPDCVLVSNSSSSTAINMSGSAVINSACLVAVGHVQTTSSLTETECSTPKTNQTAATNPYASLPVPTASGSCLSVPSGSSITLSPGNYCNGLSVSGNTTATFQPGLYYVNGNFSIQGGATATGTGVTFYISGGQNTAISGGSTVNFTAPTSGTYAGIAFFGDPTTTHGTNNFSGGSGASITGAIYYPTQQVSYTGGTGTGTGCTQLIADTITISGSSAFQNNCSGTGVKNISVNGVSSGTAQIVE